VSSSGRPTPPAADLTILAADLLAASVTSMMTELAGADKWPAAQRVRSALEAYACAREGQILTDPDPQKCQINEDEPAKEGPTERET
jgi:hypothetical protein